MDPRDATFVFRQTVVITYIDPEDGWNGVYIYGQANSEHEDAYFSNREDAIDWGKQRCDLVKVWTPELSGWIIV